MVHFGGGIAGRMGGEILSTRLWPSAPTYYSAKGVVTGGPRPGVALFELCGERKPWVRYSLSQGSPIPHPVPRYLRFLLTTDVTTPSYICGVACQVENCRELQEASVCSIKSYVSGARQAATPAAACRGFATSPCKFTGYNQTIHSLKLCYKCMCVCDLVYLSSYMQPDQMGYGSCRTFLYMSEIPILDQWSSAKPCGVPLPQ